MKRILGILGLVAVAVLILISSALGGYNGRMQRALARTFWPEKEGATHHLVEFGETVDFCIPAAPFDVPIRSSRPC
jgi:hypothetical protein